MASASIIWEDNLTQKDGEGRRKPGIQRVGVVAGEAPVLRPDLKGDVQFTYLAGMVRKTVDEWLERRGRGKRNLEDLVEDCLGPAYLAACQHTGSEEAFCVLVETAGGARRRVYVSPEEYRERMVWAGRGEEGEFVKVVATVLPDSPPFTRPRTCLARNYKAKREVRETLRVIFRGRRNAIRDAVEGESQTGLEAIEETIDGGGKELAELVWFREVFSVLREKVDLLPAQERQALREVLGIGEETLSPAQRARALYHLRARLERWGVEPESDLLRLKAEANARERERNRNRKAAARARVKAARQAEAARPGRGMTAGERREALALGKRPGVGAG